MTSTLYAYIRVARKPLSTTTYAELAPVPQYENYLPSIVQ